MSGLDVAGLLDRHGPVQENSGDIVECRCGHPALDADGFGDTDLYLAHLAAVITARIGEVLGLVREDVAEVLSCGPIGDMTKYAEDAHEDHNRWSWMGGGHGRAIRTAYLEAADETLAVVRGVLVGEAGDE